MNMGDEEKFARFLELSCTFSYIDTTFKLFDQSQPKKEIEIDNIALKKETLFIFEGKKGSPDIRQLRERFRLFLINKTVLIRKSILPIYNNTRVFHYNLKQQKLIEFDQKMNIIKTISYKNSSELIGILRKI